RRVETSVSKRLVPETLALEAPDDIDVAFEGSPAFVRPRCSAWLMPNSLGGDDLVVLHLPIVGSAFESTCALLIRFEHLRIQPVVAQFLKILGSEIVVEEVPGRD